MKSYFSAHRPFRKTPSLLSQRSRVCPEAAGLEPAESPELVEGIEDIERAACTCFSPTSMPKIPQKSLKFTRFYSFLHTGKYPKVRISDTQSATNTIPPAKIHAKSQKVAKNYPIAGISSARNLRFPAAVGSFPASSSSCQNRGLRDTRLLERPRGEGGNAVGGGGGLKFFSSSSAKINETTPCSKTCPSRIACFASPPEPASPANFSSLDNSFALPTPVNENSKTRRPLHEHRPRFKNYYNVSGKSPRNVENMPVIYSRRGEIGVGVRGWTSKDAIEPASRLPIFIHTF